MSMIETKNDLLKDLMLNGGTDTTSLDLLVNAETKYVRDLRINLKNAINVESLSRKEAYAIALCVAVNEKNDTLKKSFSKILEEEGAAKEEIAEVYSCASLLAVNNVFYRFRHFMGKESYNTTPARVKMNIMMNPVMGKEFFELMSLVVSAVNGCEMCVKAHEDSLIKMGSNETRIFDAVRIGAVVRGLSAILN